MPTGVKQLTSAIKRSRVRSKHDVVDFFQTQSALFGDRVECWGPVKDFPLYCVLLSFLFQFQHLMAKCSGFLPSSKVGIMFVPPLFKWAPCNLTLNNCQMQGMRRLQVADRRIYILIGTFLVDAGASYVEVLSARNCLGSC